MVFARKKPVLWTLWVGTFCLLVTGCDISIRRVASTTVGCTAKIASRAPSQVAKGEIGCPENLQCFYEVYSPQPVDLEDYQVAGVAFRPQLYLTEKGLPPGVSKESFREDARCFDPVTKKWVHGAPEEVLRKLHCLGS